MGKGKVLKTTISLLGKIDPSLTKALDKAQKKARDSGNSMSKNMKNAGAAMTKTIKGYAKTAIAAFASISAAAKLKEFAKECMTEAKAAIDVETKLGTLLQNVTKIQIRGPNAAADAANNLMKVADKMERSGVVAGDVMVAGFQQLASFQLDDADITTLSEGMADLLAQTKGLNASQGDAVSVANMIGKVMTGSVGALTRVGIIFDENQEKVLKMGTAEEKVAMLAEVLKQNVGGVNKALAQTDQGKLVQAENSIGQAKEEIGRKLLPIIAKVASKATPLIAKAFDKIGKVIDMVSPHADRLFNLLFSAADKIAPVFDSLGQTIFASIGGQLPSITSLLTGVFIIIQQLAPSVMSVIGAIGPAIVPIVSALFNVGQMLLPKIVSLIQSIGPLFQALSPALKFVGGLFGMIFRSAGILIGGFIDKITDMVTRLTGVIDYLNNFFAGGWLSVWNGIKSTFLNVWNSIKSIARSALSAIVSPINNIISGINKVSSAVGIKAIPAIEIPQFALGATVSRPTLAVVGEGSDPETIVPHNNKPRSRRLLAEAAAGVGMKPSKGNSYTYAPVIYANHAQGVKEVLNDDFERFKAYMRQMLDDDDREVFA